MTLVYIDGLEDNAAVVLTTGTVTTNVTARTGKGIQVSSNSTFQFRFPTPFFDTVTVGFAWRPSSLSGTNFSPAPLTLYGDAGGTAHVSMNVAGGSISVVRGTSSTPVIASTVSPPFLTANRWYYVEMQVKLHDTTGFVIIHVDGVEVLNASALDTRNAGTAATFDTVAFGMGISGTTIFDDMYLMAGAGDPFLGDCVVNTLLPSGNGTVNQFLGSDGDSTDNYLLVDELPPSGTDYVSSSTLGQQDLYALVDLPGSAGQVLAVAPTVYASKDEVGPRQVKPLLHGSATTAGTARALDFAYAQLQSVYPVNPETGLAWTSAEVNTLLAGVEVA